MAPKTSPEIGGMGHSVKRKEDPRFLRGLGNYVDDVNLPGMLYLDIVRSPYAHATIKNIDISKAMAIPGVLAVITGKDLEKYNLHWMPTLMSDTQMVLPVDKVMYQAQEVAAVLATDRYIAADGVEAVEIDYDPLPVVVDPKKALLPDAPVLRTDKKDKKDNHIWHWEWGNREATDQLFNEAEVTVKEDIYIPRIHVSSIETCGCVAHFDKVKGKLTVWMRSLPDMSAFRKRGFRSSRLTLVADLAARCRSIRVT
jgi:carbon-monoxide dehydrogenase large subunit